MLMVGKGERLEGSLHVEDICRAMIHALGNDAMIGEAYNVNDDSRITTGDFFKLVCRELFGAEKDFLRVPIRILLPIAAISQSLAKLLGKKPGLEKATLHYLRCDRVWDNSKLKRTGFRFKCPRVEEGMKETLRWYKQQGWLRP